MEKILTDWLVAEARTLGVPVSEQEAGKLGVYLDQLLLWNRKVNLTAITDPAVAVEQHLLDSLAAALALGSARSVIELGAGGGLPSIPLAIVRPGVQFTLVETVGKKVGFLKAAIASLGLPNARAMQVRAGGDPDSERLPRCDAVIARAFMEPGAFVPLAAHYLVPAGRVIAMVGAETQVGEVPGIQRAETIEYVLPRSGARRRLVVFQTA
ncbi:MAG: 16S rRNA (guanine(527)-N(7))-methyltransferase RsmG [Deltaproteobacteria bacterium]|nr:16S rRNA (guanine(527)-N(7))-methyltransferase RsmG [Deltaproteobacteria bacterium]